MNRIGIRELRQRASEFLRRVEAGESFEITDRGRPVAMLTPIPEMSDMERLEASGALRRAKGDPWELDLPIPLPPGAESPSKVLERLRADER